VFFEPFHIPSGSMKPNLLVGDYVLVNKMSYGYSKYSVPFHPDFLNFHLFKKSPKRGDVVVFVPPKHLDLYYVKRVVGLPGDKIEISDKEIYINGDLLKTTKDGFYLDESLNVKFDTLSEYNGLKKYDIMYVDNRSSLNNYIYYVPDDSLFLMGDNRDVSMDSRFQDEVGFIPLDNLVGRVSFIGFSVNEDRLQLKNSNFLEKMLNFLRLKRFFSFVN
jgi:signal peptidase I